MPVPASVEAIAAGRALHPVWENELGGLTFAVGSGPDACFVKWAPAGTGVDFAPEATRLTWAGEFTPVPRVLGQGADDDGSWLITAPVAGQSAVCEKWKSDPATAVAAIGVGLRALHDALPVDRCPFSWSVGDRLDDARRRGVAAQRIDAVPDAPPVDRLVVCHGDACTPNTLITDDGQWSGHVDFGSLGVADRWADLAIATWSSVWNYGPGWEGRLLDAYGIAEDAARSHYYRLLWDL